MQRSPRLRRGCRSLISGAGSLIRDVRCVMGRRFPRLFTALLGTLAAAFHVVFAVIPLFTAGPKDWGPAVRLLYLDYPLLELFRATMLCDPLLNTSASVWLYGILGTGMYGGFGALVGYGIDRIRNRKQAGT